MKKKLDILECIGFGWNKMKENFWFFVSAFFVNILTFIAYIILSAEQTFASFILWIFFYALFSIIGMGITKATLKIIDGEKPEFGDLFSQYKLLWQFILAFLLLSLIYLIPLLALIVLPLILLIILNLKALITITLGIIFFLIYVTINTIIFLMFGFYQNYLVDKSSTAIQSLQQSEKITNGAKWQLFKLALLSTIINIVGLLLLGIGLLFTIPTTFIAWSYAYRKLLQQTEQ